IKRVLNHDSIRKYISDAKQFYDNISKSEVNSPKWIVSHYRYHPQLKMLNNPKYDVYHILNNPTSELFYSLALENNSKADIVNIISKKFNVDENVIKKDVDEFFAQIHPNTLYKDTLKNAQ
ncbi:PqqD family protein, partial [Staphylococcus pseudintermedius]|nr:PqqD family protein [Staphylococcus pseudintermedius]